MCSGFSNAVREAFKTSLLIGRVPQDVNLFLPFLAPVCVATSGCCNFRLILAFRNKGQIQGAGRLNNLNANFDTKNSLVV